MARHVTWSELSEIDLEGIWTYTLDIWGLVQADAYLVGLNAQIRDDAKVRRLSKPLPFVRPGIMRLRYVRHYVYFYERDGGIYVERVLHDSMDETLHIP